MISVSFVSLLLPLHTLVATMCGVARKTYRPSAAAPNWPRFFICKLCLAQEEGTIHTNVTIILIYWLLYTMYSDKTFYSTVVMVLARYSRTYWASASEWWGQQNYDTVWDSSDWQTRPHFEALLQLSLYTRGRDREWLTHVVLGSTPPTLVVSN